MNQPDNAIDKLVSEIDTLRQCNEGLMASEQVIRVESNRLRHQMNLLNVEKTLAEDRVKKLEIILAAIRDQDYRGNRCSCSSIAERALQKTE